MISAQRLAVFLSLATLGYLALPVLLFVGGWLWWPWALVLTVLLVTAFGVVARRILATPEWNGVYVDALVPWHTLLFSLVPLSVITLISGVGGYGPQNIDWIKHHALLHDLVTKPWPVVYSTAGGHAALSYSFAFYLPAAIIGKAFSWAAACHALFATALLGAWLVSLWLVVFCPRYALSAVALYTFFSGMDSLGFLLHFPASNRFAFLLQQTDIDWWTAAWQLPSHITGIFWSPQHTLPAWLATALLLHGYWRERSNGMEFFLLALTLLWSPFVGLGLVPFVLLIRCIRHPSVLEAPTTIWDKTPTLTATLIIALITLFYAAHFPPLPSRALGAPLRVTIPPDGFFFAAKPPVTSEQWLHVAQQYLLCAALEFGLLALVLIANRCAIVPRERRVLGVAVAALLVLMLFRYGYYNDLVMRASLPALFTLSLLVILALPQLPTVRSRVLIGVLLALGLITPALAIRGKVTALAKAPALWQCPTELTLPTAATLYRPEYPLLLSQYLARNEAPFFRFFAKSNH